MRTTNRVQKINNVVSLRQQCVVVLEDIHDPHNAEAVFRSCDAFGIQKVCLIFVNEKKFTPKKVGKSTSASANKWLDFKTYTSTEECLIELKSQGYEIIATSLDLNSESLFETKFKSVKIALMFGNEHSGLSDTALRLADKKIKIPMSGMVQSLNLSVTTAICLYELTRQRKSVGIEKYSLPEQEKKRLIKEFLDK